MGIKKDNNFTVCDRYVKITETEQGEPRFTIYDYIEENRVDFDNQKGVGKKINGKLIELYTKEKEDDKGAKYMLYGFIFSDDEGLFNITVSKKVMSSWINRMITGKTFNLEISVFDSVDPKTEKTYRNYGIWEDGQVMNRKLDKEELNKMVKESTNAAGEKTRDFSLQDKAFKDMFEELKDRLAELNKPLTIEDLETEKTPEEDLPF